MLTEAGIGVGNSLLLTPGDRNLSQAERGSRTSDRESEVSVTTPGLTDELADQVEVLFELGKAWSLQDRLGRVARRPAPAHRRALRRVQRAEGTRP